MSWDTIKDSVEKNGNVCTLTMDILRNAHGAGKLGVNVRAEISQTLAGMGLGHIPQALQKGATREKSRFAQGHWSRLGAVLRRSQDGAFAAYGARLRLSEGTCYSAMADSVA